MAVVEHASGLDQSFDALAQLRIALHLSAQRAVHERSIVFDRLAALFSFELDARPSAEAESGRPARKVQLLRHEDDLRQTQPDHGRSPIVELLDGEADAAGYLQRELAGGRHRRAGNKVLLRGFGPGNGD